MSYREFSRFFCENLDDLLLYADPMLILRENVPKMGRSSQMRPAIKREYRYIWPINSSATALAPSYS